MAELVAGLAIPDLEITLRSEVVIQAFGVRECSPCCPPGTKLYALPTAILVGMTEPIGLPPTRLHATANLSPTKPVEDESPEDNLKGFPCLISGGPLTIPSGRARVSLAFLGNLVLQLWEREGELRGEKTCYVSYGCRPALNRPPQLFVPAQVKASVGQLTVIPLAVEDPDGDFVHVYIPPQISPDLALYYDRELGAYVVFVSATYTGPEEWFNFAWVLAYDLKQDVVGKLEPWEEPTQGQYYHQVDHWFSLRIIRNKPPRAISDSLRVSRGEIGCYGPAHYKAYDPDLPENFGFNLYFVPLGFPANWDCSRMVDIYFLPTTPGLIPQRCIGKFCELLTSCTYWPCDWPRFPIPEGTYVFPFAVVEYRRGAKDPRNPENYGFADAGEWKLIVNNRPPRVAVTPGEILVIPRQAVSAEVAAEDPDGDRIELQQRGGPGFFPSVEGVGRVQGVWIWTVPDYLRSYAGYVSFAAADIWSAGYGFLYVRTITPPQASSAHAVVRRGGLGQAYAYVHDPDSPWVSVQLGAVPSGLSVSAWAEDDPLGPGLGGFMVVF
ncbi:MAG: hypothetical protein ABDI20_08145, partial [Candidatus Bipolaricaulaceae bacterium]